MSWFFFYLERKIIGVLLSFQKQWIYKIYLQALFLPLLANNYIFWYTLRHAKLMLSIPKGLNVVMEPTFVKIIYVCFTENKNAVNLNFTHTSAKYQWLKWYTLGVSNILSCWLYFQKIFQISESNSRHFKLYLCITLTYFLKKIKLTKRNHISFNYHSIILYHVA